jgi:hypothetical protein
MPSRCSSNFSQAKLAYPPGCDPGNVGTLKPKASSEAEWASRTNGPKAPDFRAGGQAHAPPAFAAGVEATMDGRKAAAI